MGWLNTHLCRPLGSLQAEAKLRYQNLFENPFLGLLHFARKCSRLRTVDLDY